MDSGDIMAIYSVMAGLGCFNGDAGHNALRPENNFVPVSLYSEDGSLVTIPGDVNRDGAVDSGDIMTVYGIMAGN